MARFGVIVGRAIGLVLLTIVNLFVFMPVAFVMWLFRYDALAPGVRRDEASFWHGHTGRSLPKRQFTDERALWSPVGATSPRRRPVLRVATVVGVVSLLLLADLGGGWIYDEVSSETHGTAAVADDTFDPAAQPAFRDSPWASEVLAEQAALPSVKDSFLGYRLGDEGRDVHQHRRRCAHQLLAVGEWRPAVGVVLRRVGAVRRRPARRPHDPVGVRTSRRGRRHPGRGAQLRPSRYRDVAGARALRAADLDRAEARSRRVLRRVQRPRVADEHRS